MRLAGKEKKEKWLLGEKERREGKKGEGEREREIVRHRTVFLDGARNILASSFLFEKKKEKK